MKLHPVCKRLVRGLLMVAIAGAALFFSSPGDAAGPSGTLLLFDGFDGADLDTSRWSFLTQTNGHYAVADGVIAIWSGTHYGSGAYLVSRQTFTLSEDTLVLEMRARKSPRAGATWGFLGHRYSDWSTVRFGVWQPVPAFLRSMTRMHNSPIYEMVDLPQVDATVWHDYRIEFSTQAAYFYVDDQLVSTHTEQLPVGRPLYIDLDSPTHQNYDEPLYIDYVRLTQVPHNHAPTIAANQAQVVVAEGQTATNTGSWADPDGDPIALTASSGAVVSNGDGTWSWSFNSQDGPAESRSVTITADDGRGGTAEVTFDLTVENVSPTVETISFPSAPQAVDTPVAVSATFADPGLGDAPFACAVNFGDGSGDQAGTVAGNTCTAPAHSYAVPGVYTLSVQVTDKDGGAGQQEAGYLVVYDAAAGFVTGGGWIDSPAGAYAPDPSLAGRASFGFVAKYQHGATVPSGQTQFSVQLAGMSFHSTEYEWLVVSGFKARYKGVGTVNGLGTYGFLVTVTDGEQNAGEYDRFRIKIWDEGTGDVVYDNQLGSPNDADATTIIGGGSIVIHRR